MSFGLIGDLCLAILAPVIITNGVGFYWVSVFRLPPWLASWLVGIFFGCLDGIIISISASCYYRMCLAVPMEKERLLSMLGMIVYGLNYTSVPLMTYANVDTYVGENYTQSIIESDPDFAYLISNPYPKIFFDIHRPWVYVLVAVMIPHIAIQIFVLAHAFLHNMLHVYRNKDYNISPQTKVLQAQIYIVMAVQVIAVLCCGAIEGVIYAVPQLAHYFLGGLLDPFFNGLQGFFDMIQPAMALAPLMGACHSSVNCFMILLITRPYREKIRTWFVKAKIFPQRNDSKISVVEPLQSNRFPHSNRFPQRAISEIIVGKLIILTEKSLDTFTKKFQRTNE